ncbi:MAG: NTP transferase domain-containing protein [Planctomycetia bacterium]|nr:NTP transferase domain-containing protein [Planctomycetia bacterium]
MNLVIIAAGQGSRIRSSSGGIPKSLIKIKGKSIIDYLLENGKRIGVKKFIIVTGYRSKLIVDYLNQFDFQVNIEVVENTQWELANGVSVLVAQSVVPKDEPFLLSMSDHLYDHHLLKKIAESSLENSIVNVGIDYKINEIFDIDDGMKVVVNNKRDSQISNMSKNLKEYDAIDCGVFKCDYSFFNIVKESCKNNNFSLSDACNILIQRKELVGIDINKSVWFDVDTPETLQHCKNNFHLLDY